jgi:hypothetical protein
MEEGRSSRSQDIWVTFWEKIYKNRGNNAWGTGFRVRAPGNHRVTLAITDTLCNYLHEELNKYDLSLFRDSLN